MIKKATVLVVDDEKRTRHSFSKVLKDECDVLLASRGEEAIEVFADNLVDIVLLNTLLPDINGIDLLERFKVGNPNVKVIMVSAVQEIHIAAEALKLGACEYIMKPFVLDDVIPIIRKALAEEHSAQQVACPAHIPEGIRLFEKMVGEDKKMRDIFKHITRIADGEGSVLIQGESGTGKELVARAIHNLSSRKKKPFVVINSAAIPATLMESEIFGHNKGSFTGAIRTHTGRLEISDKGTVFLDDINTLNINMQAKLLRVIQEKEFERLGSSTVIKIDTRFIAASNRDIRSLIKGGEFREDLFYRLNVFPVKIPPLRKRKKDIPLLLDHFLEQNSNNGHGNRKSFSKEALDRLMRYGWPGNVRELRNIVERFYTISKDDVIDLEDMYTFSDREDEPKEMSLKGYLSSCEKEHIQKVLDSVNGNRKLAAGILGIHRNTLLGKIKELGLR